MNASDWYSLTEVSTRWKRFAEETVVRSIENVPIEQEKGFERLSRTALEAKNKSDGRSGSNLSVIRSHRPSEYHH